jgi:hypothetical protein
MLPSTILFNAVLAVAELTLVRLSRGRSPVRSLLLLLGGAGLVAGITGLVVPGLFGERMFGTLRLWSWAVFFHAPLLLLLEGLRRRGKHLGLRRSELALAALIVGVGVWSFLVEPHLLEVSHLTIESDELTRPVRLALVADIQTDRVGEYERRALKTVMAQRPDAILFAGDYISFDRPDSIREQRALAEMFADVGLSAPLGLFAVDGNTDLPGWERTFAHVDAHLFREVETVRVGELSITGLPEQISIRRGLRIPSEPGFHIVLGHFPDFALGDVDAELLLAGHCHGGQVRLPLLGAPITLSKVPREWTSGMHEIRPGTKLIVSRGIGMERGSAPRVRFHCRPEIVVIDLVPKLHQ